MRTVRRRRVVLPEPSRRPRTVWPRWAGWQGWARPLLALLPVGCVLLGGATERWSQGLMLLALGGVLLVRPPRESPGRWMNLVLGGLILLSLVAFLPAHWFFVPAWRTALTEDFGVALPTTLSPQPWLTAESCVVFAAGLSWFYLTASLRWAEDERRRAGALFAGGVVAVAGLALELYRAGVHPAMWPSVRGFGPFPNRNQTADFFAVGALPILACARTAWRLGHKTAALAWVVGWFAVAGAIFQSFSRAGVILLFATTVVYLVVETLHRTRHQGADGKLVRWRRTAMIVSLVLMLGSGLLSFGGETLTRLRSGTAMTGNNTMSDALRRAIYADTAGMVARSPWCGTGLNTFGEVFATYRRQAVQNPSRVLHPESDWLWLAAELGWPGVAAVLTGLVLVARRMRPPRHGHDRSLRLAAAIGVAGFVAHSLVDVSAHRVGSMFAALFLVGLALPGRGLLPVRKFPVPEGGGLTRRHGEHKGHGEEREEGEREEEGGGLEVYSDERVASKGRGDGETEPEEGWNGGWVFRGAGLLFVVVGLVWTLEARGVLLLPGEQGVARLRTEAVSQGRERDFAGADRTLTRALAWAPLDWRAYYMRGAAGVYGRRGIEDDEADFRRARYLEGVNAALPLDEARAWARVGQTTPAISALLEGCRRDPANAVAAIQSVYIAAHGDEDFVDQLGAATRRDPALTVALLQVLDGPDDTGEIAGLLSVDPELRRLDDAQKQRFFEIWSGRGDAQGFVHAMEAHPAWQTLGWRWWAEAVARSGEPEAQRAACGIAARYAPRPVLPAVGAGSRPLAELRRAVETGEAGPAQVFPLYLAEKAAGDDPGALETLRQATARADCPAYLFYLEATLATGNGRWDVGWEAWRKYLSARPEK